MGSELAARAAPDGYTVLFTLSSHTINPAIYPKLSFDTIKDFESIGTVASLPQILVANPMVPASTVAELVALAKAKPELLAYASVGNGSPGHLAGELFKLRTGTQMTHIPYRGGGPAVTDVISGQVPLLWVSIPAAAQFVKTGKLKALAIYGDQRAPLLPDVPTAAEQKYDIQYPSWFGIVGPPRMPADIVNKLNAEFNAALKAPDVVATLTKLGTSPVGGSPEAFRKKFQAQLAYWKKIVEVNKITLDEE